MNREKQGGIVGIYLAAGQSQRMGADKNKLALPVGTKALGSLALQTALQSSLDHVFVVTREEDDLGWVDGAFFEAPTRKKWTQIKCTEAAKGQAHSLHCGIQAAKAVAADAAMVLLADQPFVPVELIDDLISTFQRQPQEGHESAPIVASSYQQLPRPPMLFGSACFTDLLGLQGDIGARQLLRQQPSPIPIKTIAVEEPHFFFDVDCPRDYLRVVKQATNTAF